MAAKRQIDNIAERAREDRRVQNRESTPSGGRSAGTSGRSPVSRRVAQATPEPSARSQVKRVESRTQTPPRATDARPATQRPVAQQPTDGRNSQAVTTRPSPRKTVKSKAKPSTDPDEGSEHYIWLSLVLLFVAGYIGVSTFSYIQYWAVDQNIASWSNIFDNVHQDAMNWGGRLGAITGQTIIGRWFGIFGELIPLAILFLALKSLRIKSLRLHRSVRSTVVIMVVGSIGLGHLFGADPDVFGSGWGGTHGIFVAQWLAAIIGNEGTTLLVVSTLLGTMYYANGRNIQNIARRIKAYNDRRNAERALKNELAHEQRILQMQQTRQEILRQQEIRQQQIEEQELRHATQQATAATTSTPDEATTTATAPPSASAEIPAVNSEPPTTATPVSATAAEYPITAPLERKALISAVPVDRSRLVTNVDGSFGYFMGYDNAGYPIVYSLDPDTAYYSSSFGANDADMGDSDDGIEFTIESRPGNTDSPLHPPMPPAPTPIAATAAAVEMATAATTINPSLGDNFSYKRPPVEEDEEAPYISSAPSTHHGTDPGFIVEQPEEQQIDDATINLSTLYDPTLELSRYIKPPVELMDNHTRRVTVTDQELVDNKNRIVTTLESFGIRIDTIEATIGPTVTLYEIIPAPGVRISKIKNLEDDIALSLSALGIRIIAPIPGKGTIGIEVPNKDKEVVSMYSVIKSPKFHDTDYDLPVALGKTIQNETFVFDLAKMPHLLVAGATGQGKSVGLNAIITSLLYKKHPAELKFILVDPKKVELTLYQRLEKHFLAKMPDADEAIITDVQKVIFTLNSLCIEMDSRYDLLKAAKVRNIKEYNQKFITRHLNPENGHRYLPYFVVIVDEFADLIMTAGREIETPIARIAQLARAVGIHLIIATQRPTTNIITGVIKANFPARIAFRVTSMIDSRTILDQPGANQLVGRGDMLISTGNEVTRVQCAFIDTPEVERITDHIGNQRGYPVTYELPEYTPEGEGGETSVASDTLAKRDPLFEEVARYVVNNQQGSASTIQRKFSIGFNRAGRIVDQLEANGIVGRGEGSKARQVLVSDPMSLEMILDNK